MRRFAAVWLLALSLSPLWGWTGELGRASATTVSLRVDTLVAETIAPPAPGGRATPVLSADDGPRAVESPHAPSHQRAPEWSALPVAGSEFARINPGVRPHAERLPYQPNAPPFATSRTV